jgi:hypothetical protein
MKADGDISAALPLHPSDKCLSGPQSQCGRGEE